MSELDETSIANGSELPAIEADVTSGVVADRYTIEGLLGVGGVGRVYRAFDQELDEAVALKMLRPEYLESGAALTRFRKEVRLARKVTHRNVARIFDIGEHRGHKFMTMELIDGDALDDVIRSRGALPADEALEIFADVCRGVAAAHERGIVHRDLKPGNVMIERSGRVVVTDFGLARGLVEVGEALTIGGVVGTPAYMAPEQVSAEPLGPPADVYALGLILWELLLARPAWTGKSPLMVAARRTMEDPPSLLAERADLGPEFAALVDGCLARDPDGRFADASELLAAIEPLKRGTSRRAAEHTAASAPVRGREKTVAVLRFSDRGGGGDGGANLIAGLSEDLGDVLSMTRGLRLRHAGASSSSDPLAEGRKLGVDVVVVGTVRQRGDRLRVNVRVLGVGDGFQLWAGRFERPLAEALALNDEVGEAVAGALSVESPARRPAAANPNAAEAYLVLRDASNRAFMGEDRQPEFDAALERAIAAAPEDPRVLATWIATTARHSSVFEGFEVTDELDSKLRRLLSVAAGLASTWRAKACIEAYGHVDFPAAVVSLRRGLRLDSGDVDALSTLAYILADAGLADEAERLARRALWAEPSRASPRTTLMYLSAYRGDWDALTEVLEGLDLPGWIVQGNLAASRFSLWAGRWLGRTPDAIEPGRYRQAHAAITQYHEIFHRRASLDGLRGLAQALLDRAAPNSRGQHFLRQQLAEAAVYLGDHDFAWEQAVEAIERGLNDSNWLARCPLTAELRTRPAAAPHLAAAEARTRAVRRAYEVVLD